MRPTSDKIAEARDLFNENELAAIDASCGPGVVAAIRVLLAATDPNLDDRNHDELAERIADNLAAAEAGDSGTLSSEREIEYVRRVLSWLDVRKKLVQP